MRGGAPALLLAPIGSDPHAGGSGQGEALRIEYRFIQAMTCRGNRRVRIEPDGRVYADVATRDCGPGEDWNGPWPAQPLRTLSSGEVKRLRARVLASGFMALPERIARLAHDGFREEIEVAIGERRHSVTVERAEAPSAFARLRQALLAAADMR